MSRYDKEELIYKSTTDISNKYEINNNIFHIRVIRRVKIKKKNFFRKSDKHIVYYDIEYTTPDTHNLVSTDTILYDIVPSVKYDIDRENKPLKEKNSAIYKNFDEEMWKAEIFCFKYKNEKCDNGIIRKIQIFL